MADNTGLNANIKANTGEAKQSVSELTQETINLKNAVKQVNEVYSQLGNEAKRIRTQIKTSGTLSDGSKQTITENYKNDKLISTSIKTIEKQSMSLKQALSDTFSIAKLKQYFNMLTRIGKKLWDFTKMSMDFNETQNKFNVSMGSAAKDATKFVNQTTEAVGIAKDSLMNYQANFKNIMSSLGDFTASESEKISEDLVKMALDYSSLFNVDQSSAMSKFQAALVGSIRPIRSDSGYDVSDNTIMAKAKELGVEKTSSQLSQVEKRLLRIIVLMDQMKNTGAFNDLARTIEQPANQLRVLKDQIHEVGVWLGNVFIGTVGKILPYINAFVMVIKELIKLFAIFVGYNADKEAGKGLSDPLQEAESSAYGVGSGLDSANKKAKELKKTLMGFDVLNVITTPSDSSSSGGSSGGGGGIDPNILKGLETYDSMLQNVRMKATDIRDTIMDWLGFTKIIDETTGEINWKLRDGYQRIEAIRDILVGIAGGILFTKLSKLVDKVGGLSKALSGLKNFAGNMLISIGVATEFFGIKNNDMLEKLVGILEIGAGAGLKWGLKGGVIALGVSAVVTLAISGLKWTYENKDHAIDQMFGGKKNLNLMENIDAESYAWWSGFMKELGGAMGYTPEEVQQGWDDYWNTFRTNFSAFSAEMDVKIADFEAKWKNFTDTITNKENWQNYWEDVKTGAENWKNEMGTKWENLKTTIGTKMEELKTDGTNKWNTFKENLKTKTDEMKLSVSTKFIEMKANIGEKIGEIKTNAMKKWDEIKDGIREKIEWARDKVKEAIDKMKSFFNFEWKLPEIKTPHFEVGYDTSGFMAQTFASMGLPGKPVINVTWRAQGGFPEMGELFIAREAGPELVGQIGSNTAVMNNNQIVEAVSKGVAEAVSRVMGNKSNDYNFYLDGKELTVAVEKRQARNSNIYGR